MVSNFFYKKGFMGRKKKQLKVKEPIKLRSKKLANGNQSLYLDQYDPKTQKHRYEFLKLYLIPEVNEGADAINKNTMTAANAIKSQRIIELTNNMAGVKKHTARSKMLLTDWMSQYSNKKLKTGQSDESSRQIDKTIKHLVEYKGDKVRMGEIDKNYCDGFLEYLGGVRTKTDKPLSKATVFSYFKRFKMALEAAVEKEIISENPAKMVDKDLKPKLPESKREHLDVEEVKMLMLTDCKSEPTKRAYLFSCFSGLRCSDVSNLKWGDIVIRNGRQYIEITMQKTQKPLSIPLTQEALDWLPERGDKTNKDKVFTLPSVSYMNVIIKDWAKTCGITKQLSFHTARHTFATVGLTAGVDLYTVSRLLGHTNVKVTQVYAKIVDKKKEEGIDLISNLFE